MSVASASTVVLGKRKKRVSNNYVLQLDSTSCEEHTGSEYETGSSVCAITAKGSRKRTAAKRFSCTHEGCMKAYTKPSRLAEHVRSHTGDRPYVCATCSKSYLRETHLQAHSRSHLDPSARPLVCDEPGCKKRFWTAQHLRVHNELHKGEKPFKCTEDSCTAAFMKHNQLRDHVCAIHAPPGTKPYRCAHSACDKSFSTAQHLRTHSRVHEDKRYTCANPTCLAAQTTDPTFYPTWTALQHHIRTAHPPMCSHPSCNGKTFSAQKGLRAHLKIHEQREIEEGLHAVASDVEDGPPLKRRRGGEVGRDFVCDIGDCTKDFKSKKALTTHRRVNHEGRRDFSCPHVACGRSFGYKHLLQRHLAKLHVTQCESISTADEGEESSTEPVLQLDIDDITGKSYNNRAAEQVSSSKKVRCPHPDLGSLLPEATNKSISRQCDYVFSRAYDLRRHLKSEHGIDVEKDTVGVWVRRAKTCLTVST
ncbi:hypothetical protein BC835DRAFT_1315791 [Cytidiella melzeri]|nr:hypothetical protein BC835DRAFT_1315791 [Cytidiella melzeri]